MSNQNYPYSEIERSRIDLDRDTLCISFLDSLGRWCAGAISPTEARDLARELLTAADAALLARVGGNRAILQEVTL